MATLTIPNLLSSNAFACQDTPQAQPGMDKFKQNFNTAMGKAKEHVNKLEGPVRAEGFRMMHEAEVAFATLQKATTNLKDFTEVTNDIIQKLNSFPQIFPLNREPTKSLVNSMREKIGNAKPSSNAPTEKPAPAPLNGRTGTGVCYRDLRSLCHVSPAWVEDAVKRDNGRYCREKEEDPSSTAKQTDQLYHCLQGRAHELPKETRQEFSKELGAVRDYQCDNLSKIAESGDDTLLPKKTRMEAISREVRWELIRLEGQYFREKLAGQCEKAHVPGMGSNANPTPPAPPKTETESPFMKGLKEVIKDAVQMGGPS